MASVSATEGAWVQWYGCGRRRAWPPDASVPRPAGADSRNTYQRGTLGGSEAQRWTLGQPVRLTPVR